jgi:hypothetical protein
MSLLIVDLPKDRSILYYRINNELVRIFPLLDATAKKGDVLLFLKTFKPVDPVCYLHKRKVLA